MPRRPATVTQDLVKRIMKGAQEAGITMGIVATTEAVTFLPVDMIEKPKPVSSLDQWRVRRDAQKKAQTVGRSRRQGESG